MGRVLRTIIGAATGGAAGAAAGFLGVDKDTFKGKPSGVKKGGKMVGGVRSHTNKSAKFLGKRK